MAGFDDENDGPGKPFKKETVEEIKGHLIGVGYKRPPKETQFKKGKSGNPKGRPKRDFHMGGKNSANALALREAGRLISVKEGDEVRQITAIEAVMRSQYVAATKGGSAYAQKHIIERYGYAEREEQREIEEHNARWRHIVESLQAEIAKAEADGEPPPDFLPHPDDVVFEPGKKARIIGPFDEASAAKTQETIAYRDALILQAALDDRLMPVGEDAGPLEGPGTAYEFAKLMNNALPPRLRLSEAVMMYKFDLFARHSKRWLLKTAYRAWRKTGARPKRGQLFPPLRYAKEVFDFFESKREELLEEIKRWDD